MAKTSDPTSTPAPADADDLMTRIARRHHIVGWWLLLLFIILGAVLEGLHGFKVGWYLDVVNDTRRLVWRLGHAHGTLLAVVNIVFACSLSHLATGSARCCRVASPCLIAGAILLPTGFLLGGVFLHGGDPGLGILLVPVGALMMFIAVLLSARAASSAGR